MAKRPIFKDEEKPTGRRFERLTTIFEEVSDKPLPETYKAGRASQLQTAKWAGTIFESIEATEKGSYIVSGLPRKITDTDFEAFSMGIAQILYNQSHQSGNLDTNSGLERKEAKALTQASKSGHTYYEGTIMATLNELCRKSYGVDVPTTQQKEAMMSLIDTLHETPVSINFPNGDKAELYLAVKMGKFTRAKDGAITYWLTLNPIFCESVSNNFSEHPQDLTKRLTAATDRKTAAHYRLLKLLGAQIHTKKPFVRTLPVLIESLGMEEEYRKNKGRTEKRLIATCEDMIKVGIITHYETEEAYNRSRRTLSKIKFYLNPNYPRKLKEQAQDGQQTEP
jgi:hypothetical protein